MADDPAAGLQQARKLHAEGRLPEAEQAYRKLAESPGYREASMQALAELYLQAKRPDQAMETLVILASENPDSLLHVARLASLLDGFGQTEAAIGRYRRLIARQPGSAAAHFNLALLYKKEKRYANAVGGYEEALRLGIERPEEVWSNLGVLYVEMQAPDEAAAAYDRALEIRPGYLPALLNRAGLYEETGDREQAIELYRRILAIDNGHWEALARIAHAQAATASDSSVLESLQGAIAKAPGNDMARIEGLHFALGKIFDDLGRYREAFSAYRTANDAGKRLRNRPYDRRSTEQAFDRLVQIFDADWIRRNASDATASPIFICGMYRSGSTLIEQILGRHPEVTAGGELDFIPWLLSRRLAPYPQRASATNRDELAAIAGEYSEKVRGLYPEDRLVTDKKPDNFLHLGLIKAMFPAARIIHTRREPLDNCLSLYFQHLGGNLTYAADLLDAAHYYRQHERLMRHWTECFGESIFVVDYDDVVQSPEPVVRRLLGFLELEWDERCLASTVSERPVRSASVWQVRDPLHTRSSGRWRNYEPFLTDTRDWLAANQAD